MGAIPGSLCLKKRWQHPEGTRGHCHTHGGMLPPSKKCPKIPAGAGGCCCPALGSEGNRLWSFPWHIPCHYPFNSLFGTIPDPLRPPSPDPTIRTQGLDDPAVGTSRNPASLCPIPWRDPWVPLLGDKRHGGGDSGRAGCLPAPFPMPWCLQTDCYRGAE